LDSNLQAPANLLRGFVIPEPTILAGGFHAVVPVAQPLQILGVHEQRPRTFVRHDMVNVVCWPVATDTVLHPFANHMVWIVERDFYKAFPAREAVPTVPRRAPFAVVPLAFLNNVLGIRAWASPH